MADWPHQQRGVTDVLARLKAGVPSVCLSSPTGGGKSRMVQRLCEAWVPQNLRTVVLTNRRLLTGQLSQSLHASGIRVGVQAAEFESWTDFRAPVQVCSLQTLLARIISKRQEAIDGGMSPAIASQHWPLPPCDRLVIDECFVAGTLIDTVAGPVPIESVTVGTEVHMAAGVGTVEVVFNKTAKALVKVEFSDGTSIECTRNHPIFTANGWCEAGLLERGAFVLGKKVVCELWRRVPCPTLLHGRSGQVAEREQLEQADMLLYVLLQETSESDARRIYQRKSFQEVARFWSQAPDTGGQWSGADVHAGSPLVRTGASVGSRAQSADWTPEGAGCGDDVQSRPCESSNDGSNRDRRIESQQHYCSGQGRKEGSDSAGAWVVSVSHYESETDVPVYNLQVSGHPSYFANGKLVHNCHQVKAGSVQGLIQEWRQKYNMQLVGVTATPLGISHICQELIIAGNNGELRACGALVPARLHMPKVFDLPLIRRSKTGLFSQEELNSQAKAIWSQHVVGHIYGSWKDLNPHALPALGMAPGRKESLGLAMEFYSHGVNAAHICSESIYVDGKLYKTTDQADREELFERSRIGEVPVIWNRFVMREGVDLPWLQHLMLATPIAGLLPFIQVCGRVLRASPSTGKKHAIICDHGGAIDMHGSPNANRDQDWLDYYYDKPEQVTRDRMEKMTNPENKTPESIVCPKCGGMRQAGPKCPYCNFEHQASIRMVIQENGTLRPVKGDYFKKRKIDIRSDTEKLWNQVYWKFKNAKRPLTFRQAVAYFRKQHGYEPPATLPMMPKDTLDMARPVKYVARERLVAKVDAAVDVPQPKKKKTTLFDD